MQRQTILMTSVCNRDDGSTVLPFQHHGLRKPPSLPASPSTAAFYYIFIAQRAKASKQKSQALPAQPHQGRGTFYESISSAK